MTTITPEAILRFVREGESLHAEFKQRLPPQDALARTLAAFANAEGGVMLIGVGDRGEVLGLPEESVGPMVDRLVRVSRSLMSSGIDIGVVGLDRPSLGVFVGLNTPNEFINEPYHDLPVEFVLTDGRSWPINTSGGGGTSMLFDSPEDVPMQSLRNVGLYVDATAAGGQVAPVSPWCARRCSRRAARAAAATPQDALGAPTAERQLGRTRGGT